MLNMFPSYSKTVFKCRSQTLDIKDHLTYKYSDRMCRRCGVAEETTDHAINCSTQNIQQLVEKLTLNFHDAEVWDEVLVKRCVLRLNKFVEENK